MNSHVCSDKGGASRPSSIHLQSVVLEGPAYLAASRTVAALLDDNLALADDTVVPFSP